MILILVAIVQRVVHAKRSDTVLELKIPVVDRHLQREIAQGGGPHHAYGGGFAFFSLQERVAADFGEYLSVQLF